MLSSSAKMVLAGVRIHVSLLLMLVGQGAQLNSGVL